MSSFTPIQLREEPVEIRAGDVPNLKMRCVKIDTSPFTTDQGDTRAWEEYKIEFSNNGTDYSKAVTIQSTCLDALGHAGYFGGDSSIHVPTWYQQRDHILPEFIQEMRDSEVDDGNGNMRDLTEDEIIDQMHQAPNLSTYNAIHPGCVEHRKPESTSGYNGPKKGNKGDVIKGTCIINAGVPIQFVSKCIEVFQSAVHGAYVKDESNQIALSENPQVQAQPFYKCIDGTEQYPLYWYAVKTYNRDEYVKKVNRVSAAQEGRERAAAERARDAYVNTHFMNVRAFDDEGEVDIPLGDLVGGTREDNAEYYVPNDQGLHILTKNCPGNPLGHGTIGVRLTRSYDPKDRPSGPWTLKIEMHDFVMTGYSKCLNLSYVLKKKKATVQSREVKGQPGVAGGLRRKRLGAAVASAVLRNDDQVKDDLRKDDSMQVD